MAESKVGADAVGTVAVVTVGVAADSVLYVGVGVFATESTFITDVLIDFIPCLRWSDDWVSYKVEFNYHHNF